MGAEIPHTLVETNILKISNKLQLKVSCIHLPIFYVILVSRLCENIVTSGVLAIKGLGVARSKQKIFSFWGGLSKKKKFSEGT